MYLFNIAQSLVILLTLICTVKSLPALEISSIDNDIIKNTSSKFYVKDNANLILKCIGSGGSDAPDLRIGNSTYYNTVATDGNLNDISTYADSTRTTESIAFSGVISVTFNSNTTVTTATIQSLSELQNAAELSVKCYESKVGGSEPIQISILSIELRVSSADNDILKNTSTLFLVRDNANLTIQCIRSQKSDDNIAPDLMIGNYNVVKDGNLNDSSTYSNDTSATESTAFSGDITVTFSEDGRNRTITINNLTERQNSTELTVKCAENQVGESDPVKISILSTHWSKWTCDVEKCQKSRTKHCLIELEGKDACEMNEEGCNGTGQTCRPIPSVTNITVTQQLVNDKVKVTVFWVRSSLPVYTADEDLTANVKISGESSSYSRSVTMNKTEITFENLDPNSEHNASVVYSTAEKRSGQMNSIRFTTLSKYLTMLPIVIDRDSNLTISWNKVHTCQANNATVTVNGIVSNIGSRTSYSFSYDQTKSYNIDVVSRGCGDIISPKIPLDDFKTITILKCGKTPDDDTWERKEGTYRLQTVKCTYYTTVDLYIDCSLGDKIIEGAPFVVTKETGFVSRDVVACKNKRKMLCRARSKSGATIIKEVELPEGNGDRLCAPVSHAGKSVYVIQGYLVALIYLLNL